MAIIALVMVFLAGAGNMCHAQEASSQIQTGLLTDSQRESRLVAIDSSEEVEQGSALASNANVLLAACLLNCNPIDAFNTPIPGVCASLCRPTLSSLGPLRVHRWKCHACSANDGMFQTPKIVQSVQNVQLEALTIQVLETLDGHEGLEYEQFKEISHTLGPEHKDTLKSKGRLANILRLKGYPDNAEKWQQDILQIRNCTLGPDHPDTLKIKSDLAKTWEISGALAEAQDLQKEVLEIRERINGPEDPLTLASKSDLASILHSGGDKQTAKKLLEEVLEVKNRTLGPENPETLLSKRAFAKQLHNLGDLGAAILLHREILETKMHLSGRRDPGTLQDMSELAKVLRSHGDLNEAEKFYREVSDGKIEIFGAEHPETLSSKSALASTLYSRGDLEGAEVLQQEVCMARMEKFGRDHPDTLASQSELVATLRCRGDLQRAINIQRKLLTSSIRKLGLEDEGTLRAKNDLANICRDLKDLEGAEAMLREVLKIRIRTLGPDHETTLATESDLASSLICRGDLPSAESLVRKVSESRSRALGPSHLDTLTSKNTLAIILQGRRNLQGAEKLLLEVLEARRTQLGPEHPETLRTMNELGTTLFYMGSLKDAEKLQWQVLDARYRILGPDHPDTMRTENDLGRTLRDRGEESKAEALRQELLKARSGSNLTADTSPSSSLQDDSDRSAAMAPLQESLVAQPNVSEGTVNNSGGITKFSSAIETKKRVWFGRAFSRFLRYKLKTNIGRSDNVVTRIQQSSTGLQCKRYSSADWLDILKQTASSVVLRRIRVPVFVTMCWAAVLAAIHMFIPFPPGLEAFRLLGATLPLLLVFRTNSGYQRFWEGRKIWEDLQGNARGFASMIAAYCDDLGSQQSKRLGNLICAFCILLSERCGKTPRNCRLSDYLTPEDAERIQQRNNPPLKMTSMLDVEIKSIAESLNNEHRGRDLRKQLWDYTKQLRGNIGACEKLMQTPVPLSYARHTSRVLTLWCFMFPAVLVQSVGPAIVPLTGLVTWVLFGIQEIGLMIEQPFQRELPLDQFVSSICADVTETINDRDI